ncbi:uncharacterized protein CBL_02344 [Carabus blaptoides fortunei]
MALIQPSGEMLKKIQQELNENIATRDSDLETIKEWLRKQPHLPDAWDDARIMTYLRGCKFSLEKTKRKLDMYFTMKTAVPEFFADRDITKKNLQDIVTIANVPALPGLTPEGRRVIIFRGLDKDIPTPNIADGMKVILMIGDVRLAAEEVGVAGDVYILDASVATANHLSKVTPGLVKKFLVCVQEAYPVKLKEVHVVNVSPIVDTIINFVKPFLKEKIKNRIFVHSTLESLQKYVPKDVLPEEYGGNAGKIQEYHDQWIKKLEDYLPWFQSQEDVKADESKRPGKPTNYEDLFGMEGSFRQLSID